MKPTHITVAAHLRHGLVLEVQSHQPVLHVRQVAECGGGARVRVAQHHAERVCGAAQQPQRQVGVAQAVQAAAQVVVRQRSVHVVGAQVGVLLAEHLGLEW